MATVWIIEACTGLCCIRVWNQAGWLKVSKLTLGCPGWAGPAVPGCWWQLTPCVELCLCLHGTRWLTRDFQQWPGRAAVVEWQSEHSRLLTASNCCTAPTLCMTAMTAAAATPLLLLYQYFMRVNPSWSHDPDNNLTTINNPNWKYSAIIFFLSSKNDENVTATSEPILESWKLCWQVW